MDRSELNRLRRLHAIGNPTIVAQYFHFVVDSFLKKLLCTDSGKVGILGEIANHFAVVEENSRHMLHLHGFAWVTGNMNFTKLQNRVLADTELRNRLVSYLQATICEVIDEPWAEEYKDSHPDLDRFTDNPIPPTIFGPGWRRIRITSSPAASCTVIPSLVSSMTSRSRQLMGRRIIIIYHSGTHQEASGLQSVCILLRVVSSATSRDAASVPLFSR